MENVPAWSYTALAQFENCPRQYWLAKVSKQLPFVETEAIKDGNTQHAFLENRLTKKEPLPEHLQRVEPLFTLLERGVQAGKIKDVQAELEFVFDRNLKMIHVYGQRSPKPFFMKGAWLRAKFDLLVLKDDKTALITDWKFGKFRPAADQLELFAGIAFKALPALEMVKTSFSYPRLNQVKNMTFFRQGAEEAEDVSGKSEADIWGEWLGRVQRLDDAYAANNWPCRPSGLCGWCDATPKQCPHSKK